VGSRRATQACTLVHYPGCTSNRRHVGGQNSEDAPPRGTEWTNAHWRPPIGAHQLGSPGQAPEAIPHFKLHASSSRITRLIRGRVQCQLGGHPPSYRALATANFRIISAHLATTVSDTAPHWPGATGDHRCGIFPPEPPTHVCNPVCTRAYTVPTRWPPSKYCIVLIKPNLI